MSHPALVEITSSFRSRAKSLRRIFPKFSSAIDVRRAIIVGQVKVCDAAVERAPDHRSARLEYVGAAQSSATAPVISGANSILIARTAGIVHRHIASRRLHS